MAPTKDHDTNFCSYGLKCFVAVLGIIGVVLSILMARHCEFISFVDTDGNPPDMAEDPPFNTALAGTVGVFGYQITNVFQSGSSGTNGCLAYEDNFGQQKGYPSLATAQFCALLAPIFAGIGCFFCLVDLCVFNFFSSFMITSVLFLIAGGLQAGVFTLLADPAFCLEDAELECTVGGGAKLNIAATIFYFCCALFVCCAPRADPFCYYFGAGPSRADTTPKKRREEPEQQPQQQVIVQPVVVSQPPPAAPVYYDEYGNPIVPRDQFGNPIVQRDAYGNPIVPRDQYGNPIVQRDQYGNPIGSPGSPRRKTSQRSNNSGRSPRPNSPSKKKKKVVSKNSKRNSSLSNDV